jgi:hypothetical protein
MRRRDRAAAAIWDRTPLRLQNLLADLCPRLARYLDWQAERRDLLTVGRIHVVVLHGKPRGRST